jgi:L-methionine (R)-S-oxide reductase
MQLISIFSIDSLIGKIFKVGCIGELMRVELPEEKGNGLKVNIFNPQVKKELYEKAVKEIKGRVKNVESVVPRMATVAAVLKNTLPHYFWCGFYFAEENEMIIGPYQGTSACPNIEYSGVCGTSAKKKESVIVPNVHEFPGHIPCDERSNSEIVVPIFDKTGRVIAVIDVDSTEINAFDEIDKEYLEKHIIPILLEKED